MKKVLVLAAVVALLATPAFASIVDSKHDLSSGNTATWGAGGGSDTDQVCVFCHTPHNAQAAGGSYRPLWNRTTVPAVAGAYTSDTLDVTAAVASDAPLCYSCHDGTALAGAELGNSPNDVPAGVTVNASFTGGAVGAYAQHTDNDVTNDHPMGFNIASASLPGEINDFTTGGAMASGAIYPLYGSAGDEFWCSTCHDVHASDVGNVANSPFFLRAPTAGSALCLDCHQK